MKRDPLISDKYGYMRSPPKVPVLPPAVNLLSRPQKTFSELCQIRTFIYPEPNKIFSLVPGFFAQHGGELCCVTAWVRTWFVFIAEWYPTVWLDHGSFVHVPAE